MNPWNPFIVAGNRHRLRVIGIPLKCAEGDDMQDPTFLSLFSCAQQCLSLSVRLE